MKYKLNTEVQSKLITKPPDIIQHSGADFYFKL